VTAVPGWSRLLLFAGLAVLCAAMMGAHFFSGRRRQRRAYWLGWLLGGSLVAISVAHRGLDWVLLLSGTVTVFSVLWAFMKTPYLKLGGRIHALTLDNRRPDPFLRVTDRDSSSDLPADRYGNLSARTFWWLAAILIGAAGAAVTAEGWHTRAGLAAGFFTVTAGLAGYGDGRAGFSRARGQLFPALVATAASVLLFGVPPALYLLGHQIGSRFTVSNRARSDQVSQPAHTGSSQDTGASGAGDLIDPPCAPMSRQEKGHQGIRP
jgi:hypothetical protein